MTRIYFLKIVQVFGMASLKAQVNGQCFLWHGKQAQQRGKCFQILKSGITRTKKSRKDEDMKLNNKVFRENP